MTTAGAGDPVHGEYLVTISGGCGCHFDSDLGGLAGGRKFEGPSGVVYAANLTSDMETGIAHDDDETLIGLLRTGQESEDGETLVLSPIMPYHIFSILSDTDAQDIVAYLRTLPPINNPVPERELTEEPEPFTPAETPPAEAPTDPVARGEYIVTLAMCGRCHTPTNADGSPAEEMLLAGAPMSDDSGEVAANITPDEATGIGAWTEEQIAEFMRTGTEPDGEQIEGAMAQQIERRFSKLTEEDAAAIAAYLKSIPAVANDPSAAQ
jgi:mono/diheme cytochrome c family protein